MYSLGVTLLTVALLAGVALAIFIGAGVLSVGEVKIKLQNVNNPGGQISGYIDLDNDGEGNFVVIKSYPGGFPALEYYQERDRFIDVIRPRGNWFLVRPSYCFGDHDNDGYYEAYLFTESSDSILLNAYEPLGDDGHFIKNLFLDKSLKVEEKSDLIIESAFVEDDNGDGYQEFFFFIKSGYSLSPRKVYRYDFGSRTLHKGANTAAGLAEISIANIDEDPRYELIVGTNALENFDLSDTLLPYNDNSAWILAYDDDLQDMIFATEIPDNKSHLNVSPVTKNGIVDYLLVRIFEHTTNNQYLTKYTLKGELIEIVSMDHERSVNMIKTENAVPSKPSFSDGRSLFIYDNGLELQEEKKAVGIPEIYHRKFMFVKETGYFLFSDHDIIHLFNTDMKELGEVRIQGIHRSNRINASLIRRVSDREMIVSLTNPEEGEFIFSLKKRKLLILKQQNFPWAGILLHVFFYLLFFVFFYLVFRLQFYYFNKRMASEQLIQSLQLQTVQNQLQPHFTFNVLNTIGSLIYKDEKESAYEYLNHFSDMLRSTLISGEQSDWMIDEELRFIKTYVDMENLRFDDRFDFILDISPELDISYRVPKLMIQTFVENAVSHGLMHKKEDCRLALSLSEDLTHIIIVIEDNGIGRLESSTLKRNNVGHGNKILENYMEVYNKIKRTNFLFITTDLINKDGTAGGTKVTLRVPKDYFGKTKTQA